MRNSAGFILALILLSCHSSPDSLLWRLHLQNRSYATPVVDQNHVFIVSSAGEVICLSEADGKIVWKTKLDSPIVVSPAYSSSSLFVGTQDGMVISFNKTNGAELWRKHFEGEGFEAPLSIIENLVLVPSTTGRLYAISQLDGQSVWTHAGSGKYTAAALVSGNHIFIGSWKGDFFCIRQDGREQWKFQAAAGIVDTASVFQNIVCIPTHGRILYAVDAPSGRLLWRFSVTYPTVVVIAGTSSFFGSGKDVYRIQVQDGRLLQKNDVGKTVLNMSPSSRGFLVITDRILELDSMGRIRIIPSIPHGVKPFKVAESRSCYIVTDELYSVLCIQK